MNGEGLQLADEIMEEQPQPVPARRGRPPARVDQRIERLAGVVGAMAENMERFFQRFGGENLPLTDNQADPGHPSGVNERRDDEPEGTGETENNLVGSAQPTRTRGSMGSRQRRARRQAEERAAQLQETRTDNVGRARAVNDPAAEAGLRQINGRPPRPPGQNPILIESGSVQNGNLRERLQARRGQCS